MKNHILIKKYKYAWCNDFLYSLSFDFGNLGSYNFVHFDTIKDYFCKNIENEEIKNSLLNCSSIEELVKIFQENVDDIKIIFRDFTKGE